MTLHRRLRVGVAAAVAAVVAAPVAGAVPLGGTVQVGGKLVVPAQLSSSHSSRLVEVGGALVSPQNLSVPAGRSDSSDATTLPTSDSSFGWHDAGIGFGVVLGALLFVGASAYVRRTRVTSA
jgi:hypothetical protein